MSTYVWVCTDSDVPLGIEVAERLSKIIPASERTKSVAMLWLHKEESILVVDRRKSARGRIYVTSPRAMKLKD